MPQAKDIHGTAFKNGPAVLMARIVDNAGDAVTQAGVASIAYSVYELNPCRPDVLAVVAGHDGAALDVDDVIFDTLQTGGLWTVDAIGYNFRHEIDVSTDEAFPKAGALYQVRYEIVPTGGHKVIVRFQIRVM